jgi:hypothetical protein
VHDASAGRCAGQEVSRSFYVHAAQALEDRPSEPHNPGCVEDDLTAGQGTPNDTCLPYVAVGAFQVAQFVNRMLWRRRQGEYLNAGAQRAELAHEVEAQEPRPARHTHALAIPVEHGILAIIQALLRRIQKA